MRDHPGQDDAGSELDQAAFFEAQWPRLKSVIRYQMRRRGVPDHLKDDIEQECLLEAYSAIPRYDPSQGSFTNYMKSSILWKIQRALAEEGHVALVSDDRTLHRTVAHTEEELLNVLRREPTSSEVAARSGLSLEEVEGIPHLSIASLDQSASGEENAPPRRETLAGPGEAEDESDSDDRAERLALVERCRAVLTDGDQLRIFNLRYARLITDGDPLTMEHAALEAGIPHIDDAWVVETLALDALENAGVLDCA